MGKHDQTTTQKLDPMAEKMRNIYYNATLDKLGMGATTDYNKGGHPQAPAGSTPAGGGIIGLSGILHNPARSGPPVGDPGSMAGGGGVGLGGTGGIEQYGGPMVNAMAPQGDPWSQDAMGPGTDVAGYDPGFGQAYRGVQDLGALNAGQAKTGYDAANRYLDPAQAAADAQARFNPFVSGVIDPLQAKYAENLAKAKASVGSNAIAQGAFGGSRHGVAEGEAARGITLDNNLTIANLMAQGYSQAQAASLAAAQLGAQSGANAAGQAGQNFGQAGLFSEQARQLAQNKLDMPFRDLGILGAAVGGAPVGSTTTAQGSGGNPFTGALGGAATGAGIGSLVPGIGTGLGAGIGAGVGLLGSFF